MTSPSNVEIPDMPEKCLLGLRRNVGADSPFIPAGTLVDHGRVGVIREVHGRGSVTLSVDRSTLATTNFDIVQIAGDRCGCPDLPVHLLTAAEVAAPMTTSDSGRTSAAYPMSYELRSRFVGVGRCLQSQPSDWVV